MAFNTPVYVKSPNAKSYFDAAKAKELVKCAGDPIYFSENYVMIQHPVKGNIPFRLYGFQKNLINAFSNNKYVVALTARQMGKTLQANTIITYNENKVNISSLIPMTFKQKIVSYLENLLLKLSK
jgi:hypothetical protein